MDALATLAAVGSSVVFCLLFAAVVRRVLGVPVSLVRAALAALAASFAANPLLAGLIGTPADDGRPDLALGLYLALVMVFAVVLAMLLLVVAEILVPDGSLPGPLELWRNGRARLARSRRYAQILRILAGRGLTRFLRGREPRASSSAERRELARSLRLALEEGGVAFVKLGQQLSTRRDLLPPEVVDELSRLQDAAAPIPFTEVRDVLAREWGRPPEAELVALAEQPMGSASIAQVHAATLRDGTEVVLKVQRPGIAETVERDLDIVARLATTLAERTSWGEQIGIRALADGFADALREELDFGVELRSTALVASELAATPGVRVPRTYPQLSTARLLVMERMPGRPLGAAADLLAALGPQRRREIADALLGVVMGQVLRTGVFHVDLHPGNVLVDDDGTVALLDLGSVGRLGDATRENLVRLFGAIGTGSSQTATDALLDLVDRPEEVDERALEQAVGTVLLRFSSGGPGAAAAAFAALFRLVADHGLGVPPAVAAVFRAVATLEGTLLLVDPEHDMVARVQALGHEQLAAATDPAALRDGLEREVVALLPVLRRLPRRVDRLADAAEHGRLSVGVRLLGDRRDRDLVVRLWHQGLQTVLAATAGLMAVALFAIGPGPGASRGVGVFWVLGTTLLCAASVLALRVLMAVLRRQG